MTAVGRRVARAAGALLTPVLALGACSGGDGDGDLAAFCSLADDQARFEDVFDQLDPADVPAALGAFDQVRAHQRTLLEVAPDEPARDLEIVIDFVDDLIAGLEAEARADERPSIYDDLRPRFDRVEAAGNRLEQFVTTSC